MIKRRVSSEFQKYRRNSYSQNGEDGVIQEMLNRLDISQGWFCEFGAWDGKYSSNAFALLKKGWSGVMIEGDPIKFRALLKTASKFPHRLHPMCRSVDYRPGPDTLDAILETTPIPRDFEVLSIDVDGYDYQIWASLKNYRPLIVIIEINSGIPPGVEQTHAEDKQGSSFTSTLRLGQSKDYAFVCHTGNMIFVRNDQVRKLKLAAEELANPDQLFVYDYVNPTVVSTWARKIRNLTVPRLLVRIENFLRLFHT